VYEKEQHHFHIPQFRKASVYDTLEATFGWILLHRDRLIHVVWIMRTAQSEPRYGDTTTMTCLPRDVFLEIIVLLFRLVEAHSGYECGAVSLKLNPADRRRHFVVIECDRPSWLGIMLCNAAYSAKELYESATGHCCPHVHVCPVPECAALFADQSLLDQHLRADCARSRFPCLLCGQLISRTEHETHASTCQFKCIKINMSRQRNVKVCDSLEAGVEEDTMTHGLRKSRIVSLTGKGKAKSIDEKKGEVELVCSAFNGVYDGELRSLTKVKHGYYRCYDGSLELNQLVRQNVSRFQAFSTMAKEFEKYTR
jgi:hypothetical protein